ncbi:DUF2058 domain-containing protein [Moritella sp. 24]|uniref:DUF2058 domain-containing protein n=1 Tax=Moritella sp. 24 TaxID=2746230 RepID=UPI001BAE0373|nr:DUF2058 domain-containing protein [Moritella sp. 24]QUM76506.1 DUF2058 domain-containing protein [Moritella sp. 24]
MASLQEQLLKAGLADEKKAKKIRKEKNKTNKAVRKNQQNADTSLQDEIKVQKNEQAKLDAERNRVIQEQIELKSEHGKVKQMIQQLHITDVAGETAFNYVLDNKVKTLSVDKITYNALTKGQIGLCVLEGKPYIMPSIAIEKIKAVDEAYVLVLNENTATEIEEDDPYADFQIPDDLMW